MLELAHCFARELLPYNRYGIFQCLRIELNTIQYTRFKKVADFRRLFIAIAIVNCSLYICHDFTFGAIFDFVHVQKVIRSVLKKRFFITSN